MLKDWCSCEGHLELFEGGVHFLGELKHLGETSHLATHKQCSQGLDNPRKICDEMLVEVCKAQEHLDVMVKSGCWPVVDAAHSVQLHCDTLRCDNVANKADSLGPELALFQVQIQASLAEVA